MDHTFNHAWWINHKNEPIKVYVYGETREHGRLMLLVNKGDCPTKYTFKVLKKNCVWRKPQ